MLKQVTVGGEIRTAVYHAGRLVGFLSETRRFTRHGKRYYGHYSESGKLLGLVNATSGEIIPPETRSFRRLADGNRGGKFAPTT